jgi:nucleoside 2-deoxyribosyltransferase
MKTIAIGCSMKYRSTVRDTIAKMSAIGLNPVFPNLDYSHENTDKADTPEEKKRLAMEHYDAIKKADAVYLITPEGYMGTSCKLELGYAIALGKPVFFSEPTNDPALDCYVSKFIPLDKLETFQNL